MVAGVVGSRSRRRSRRKPPPQADAFVSFGNADGVALASVGLRRRAAGAALAVGRRCAAVLVPLCWLAGVAVLPCVRGCVGGLSWLRWLAGVALLLGLRGFVYVLSVCFPSASSLISSSVGCP